MSSSTYWNFKLTEVKQITEKAMLLDLARVDELIWVPISQIADPERYNIGDHGTISITQWFVEKQNLEKSKES